MVGVATPPPPAAPMAGRCCRETEETVVSDCSQHGVHTEWLELSDRGIVAGTSYLMPGSADLAVRPIRWLMKP